MAKFFKIETILLFLFFFTSCDNDSVNPITIIDDSYIVGHEQAYEHVLRSIPVEYINKARQNLHIGYQHTSHGTHVTYGLYGLQDYKIGDDVLFGVTHNNRVLNKLDIQDNEMENYAPPGIDGRDLSKNETAFIQTTRNYLDDPANEEINVIMWSWCNIAGHNVSGNYIKGMDSLIHEYAIGGTKIGTGSGQRKNPVTFIFMTGHANADGNIGEGNPADQASLIIDYCKNNNQFCLDYYSIDTHDMGGNYWDDAGDDGDSKKYGGYFYHDWQDSHKFDIDYYENKVSPGGEVHFGGHATQHITSNRKAYAFWWILARISGWDGK